MLFAPVFKLGLLRDHSAVRLDREGDPMKLHIFDGCHQRPARISAQNDMVKTALQKRNDIFEDHDLADPDKILQKHRPEAGIVFIKPVTRPVLLPFDPFRERHCQIDRLSEQIKEIHPIRRRIACDE